MKTVILNTQTCRIFSTDKGIVLEMKLENGGWVRQMPYSSDLKGLVAALTLSVDVVAGKVWLDTVAEETEQKRLTKN
jgi:hypothetical protein